MCTRTHRQPLSLAAAAVVLALLAACGSKPASDPGNREIPWTYGPTTGTETPEHAKGTGRDGGVAIAKGWQCRLQNGTQLTVRPYQLASSHPLFGKVAISVGLFDKTGKQLALRNSPVLTPSTATFTLELDEALAAQLWDLVFWYGKA